MSSEDWRILTAAQVAAALAPCCKDRANGELCCCYWEDEIERSEFVLRLAHERLAMARRDNGDRERLAELEHEVRLRRMLLEVTRNHPPRFVRRLALHAGRSTGTQRHLHQHRGRSRAARCAAPRVRGSRRTAARTTLNTGPPGADDGPSSAPPRSLAASLARRARHHATNPTPGANRRAERAKTTGRARRSVWGVGGTSRRVGEPRNDESPRGATLAGIPNRAGERGVTAGQTPRILADSRSATQTQARATEAASGG